MEIADWPDVGSIDLTLHDLPHHSSAMEWWYLNAHLETETGQPFSLRGLLSPHCGQRCNDARATLCSFGALGHCRRQSQELPRRLDD